MIEAEILAGAKRTSPFYIPWPIAGNPGAILTFDTPEDWLSFLRARDLHPAVPQITSAKYHRAQRLFALGWLDFDLIKAGELVAVTALEFALKERYFGAIGKKRPMFDDLLHHLVEKDGLSDSALPFTRLYGGSAIDFLYETSATRDARKALGREAQPTLHSIRNSLAHGDPFDGLPWSGLLELIRDLIEYAYREMIAGAAPYNPNLPFEIPGDSDVSCLC